MPTVDHIGHYRPGVWAAHQFHRRTVFDYEGHQHAVGRTVGLHEDLPAAKFRGQIVDLEGHVGKQLDEIGEWRVGIVPHPLDAEWVALVFGAVHTVGFEMDLTSPWYIGGYADVVVASHSHSARPLFKRGATRGNLPV